MGRILRQKLKSIQEANRRLNEQNLQIPTDLEGDVPPEAYVQPTITGVTHDELMEVIKEWCEVKDIAMKSKGLDITQTTSSALAPEMRKIVSTLKGYCNTLRGTDIK
tara:strand:- start:200 stop:520 length:321 start_codon:yes stop_codon:yes gene_type:complete